MVSKKILGVAIAAAFVSQGAFAAINLGTAAGAVTYAKETIATGDISAVAATLGLLNVTAAGTELDVVVPVGFGVTATTHAFIRFDLTNAKFRTQVVSGDLTALTGTITNVTVAQGGAVGDSYVIFDVTSGGLAQTDNLQLDLAGLAVSTSAPVTVTFNHYSTSPAAVANSGGSLSTKSYASAITVADDLKVTIAATDRVADVSASPAFTQFVSPASATASLGTIQFDVLTAGALNPAGTVVTAANATTGATALFDPVASTLTVGGDLSYTVGANAGATAANLTFEGIASDTAATNVPSAKKTDLSNAAIATFANPVDVAVTATSAINAGAYTLAFAPAKVAGRQFSPTGKTAALGTITRSGTTIQVPYVTTYSDYNQRLVLVNRSGLTAPYSITFTPEAGTTATAKAAATGNLAPGKTLVLKATDVVDITGNTTRTAATIVVTAPSSTIDAATTSVNISDKSTDTVKLQ